MCLVPTLVTVKLGTVGASLSRGSDTVTVLLLADLVPAASMAYAEKEYVAPLCRGGWGYFHVTLVWVPGTLISRLRLSRSRYEALPLIASHANETLHDVFPVTRRFKGPVGVGVGGFFRPNAGESGGRIDDASGAVLSRHAAITTRIDPARARKSDCRSAERMRSPLDAE